MLVALTSSKNFALSIRLTTVENALKDVCFPLHNFLRYKGETEIMSHFEDLVRRAGSNKIKVSGNKLFLIEDPANGPALPRKNQEETLLEIEDISSQTNFIEKPEGGPSKIKKVFQNFQDLFEGFNKDTKSKLEGKFAVLNTKAKLWPLSEVFTLNKFLGLRFSSRFPVLSLRNYFGPKIALYFYFLGFFINRLFIIGLVGIGVFVVHFVISLLTEFAIPGNQDPSDSSFDLHSYLSLGSDFVLWLYSIYIFFWSFRFARDWEVHEKLFQIQNGDIATNSGNIKDEERINIKKYFYTRSLVTDEMNTKSNHSSQMALLLLVAVAVTFILGAICLGVSVQILELKRLVVSKFDLENVVHLNQQIGELTRKCFGNA